MAIASVTLVTDTPGRVLTGVAALGLILFASATWRARPRLAITPDGLAIRGWFRTQLLRHSNIKIMRIDEFRRYGRLVRLLEIETVSGGAADFVPLGSRHRPSGGARRAYRCRLRRSRPKVSGLGVRASG